MSFSVLKAQRWGRCGRGALLLTILLGFLFPLIITSAHANPSYPWLKATEQPIQTLASRINPPTGFKRIKAEPTSFAHWLRQLPMKRPGTQVKLHNGAIKLNQHAHWDILDVDVGKRDLQQCADAIMRLRAEYLYAQKRLQDIAFNFTNGKRVAFTRRYKGRDYKTFRKYMNLIFAYAGTYSLAHELKKIPVSDMKIGDVFIKGGFPGHAILVADMVQHPKTGEKRFLLVQSFMPAQDIHVLKNPKTPHSPWYKTDFGTELVTPEWVFKAEHLERFSNER